MILLVSLFFLIAVGLCLYPFLSNYIFEHQTDSLVHTVEQDVEQVENTEKETAFAEAKKYNEVITSGVVKLQDHLPCLSLRLQLRIIVRC